MYNMPACSLQEPTGVWQGLFQGLLQPATRLCQPSVQQLEVNAAAQLYASTLVTAAATARCSINPDSRRKRDRIVEELSQFLAMFPGPAARTVHDCTPEDLLGFLQHYYISEHAGSMTPDQQAVMAPGSISNAVSALHMGLQELQRCGPWQPHSRLGNPVKSFQVQQWRRGYIKQVTKAGFIATGAREMTEDKLGAMLLVLKERMHASSDPMYISLQARDAFVFSLLWSTGARGINGSNAALSEFMLPASAATSSRSVLPLVYPTFMLQPGQVVEYIPRYLKTSILANSQGVCLTTQAHGLLDPLHWLHVCLATAAACGYPITGPLVRYDTEIIPAELHARLSMQVAANACPCCCPLVASHPCCLTVM